MTAWIRSVSRLASEGAGTIAVAIFAAGALLAIFVLISPGAGRGAEPRDREAIATAKTQRSEDCPQEILRLSRDAPAPATLAALAEAPDAYSGIDTERARAEAGARATSAERGGMVRRMCGNSVARRTVVVDLLFPELRPSASLSQGTVFVSRFADGYHIWLVAR